MALPENSPFPYAAEPTTYLVGGWKVIKSTGEVVTIVEEEKQAREVTAELNKHAPA